jgi:hypothetical protein
VLVAAAACGGGSDEQQPEVIATFNATASPTPSPAPTAKPATATASVKPSSAPSPTATGTPAPNRDPSFPRGPLQFVDTTYERDETNAVTGAVTTMIAPAATDADGDQPTYSWSVTTGTITNVGLKGTWVRDVADGKEAPGKVTVTASDGRGGNAAFIADFQ